MKNGLINSIILILIFLCSVGCSIFNEEYEAISTDFLKTQNTTVEENTIDLPILMYHKVYNKKKDKYTVSSKQLEQDFIALKDEGYQTVFLSEVIDYVENGTPLPEKPIVLTFDDGYYNNMYYAFPLAKKYNLKFMFFPVTSFSEFSMKTNDTENVRYSYITFDRIGELANSGLVEIGNHTHNMHNLSPRKGIKKLKGEKSEAYEKLLREDITKANDIIEKSSSKKPQTFAYPYGSFDNNSHVLLKNMGFKALLTCVQGINRIDKSNSDCLLYLKRINRDGNMTSSKLIKTLKTYTKKLNDKK